MKNQDSSLRVDQRGIAHLGLILIVIAVLGLTGFAASRVISGGGDDSEVALTDEDQELEAVEEEVASELDDDQNKADQASDQEETAEEPSDE